tara:strand:+ start:1220 stop:1894 length:675 start_codon:yes stop_codon:yes gene_type:complete
MSLSKLGIKGMLAIGALVSIASILVSILSLFNGTYKDENDSTKNTNYKTTWRFANAILKSISLLMIVGIWVSVTFINKTDVLSTDFTWRLIIGTTIFVYLVSTVFNWVNLFIPWGEGPGVHIARIIIESINIVIGLYQFWSYSTKLMASIKHQGVTDVMKKNPLYEGPTELLHLGKNLETKVSSFEETKQNQQAQKTKEALQVKEEFGKRQRRRNPSKRRKKRK